MKSEKIDLLIKALIKAKTQIRPVEKNKENPFFKSYYATLDAVEASVKEPLHDNGLVVTQTTAVVGGQAMLVTTLMHESGQWIEGHYPLNPTKNDPQGLGAAMTYARRYALSALLGVVADEDDDGAAASRANGSGQETAAAKSSIKTITDAQGKRLYAIWKSNHQPDDEVKSWLKTKYGFNSTRDITSDKYEEICKILGESPVGA